MNKRWLATLLFSALSMLAGWLLPFMILGRALDTAAISLLNATMQILMFGLPAFLMLRYHQAHTAVWLSFRRLPSSMDSGLTLLAAVSYVVTGAMISTLFYQLLTTLGFSPSLPEPLVPQSIPDLLMMSAAIAVVTPICEELFFRETIPLLLSKRMNMKMAGLAGSLFFAAIHFSVLGFPSLLIFGLLAHQIRWKKNSLSLSILFHAMYNFSILVMNYADAAPGIGMILLSLAAFILAVRLLFKEESHGDDLHRPGL